MKRIRTALAALAVIAIVGTTLAFNARTQVWVYKKDINGDCPKLGRYNPGTIQQLNVYTTSVDAGATVPVALCTSTYFVKVQ